VTSHVSHPYKSTENGREYRDATLPALHTGRFKMFSVISNIYNKKTKGPTLTEFFTATGKMKRGFF
jgi:hypothetical protein